MAEFIIGFLLGSGICAIGSFTGYKIGKGERIINADKIGAAIDELKSGPKAKPEVASWTDEEEAELEERESRKNKKTLTDEEYFELAKKQK